MNNPVISVIVPVYNVEKYLHICVDSLLAQSFTDFEILLIDDGSHDKSGKICDEYAQKDKRVRVLHKENGGVSSARNIGLNEAKGEWITFVDSDDWVSSTFLNNLYAPIEKNENIDFVQAGCTNYINNKIAHVEQKYDYIESDDPIYVFNNFRGLTCSKLFRLEKVIMAYGLKFDEMMHRAEDMAFTLDYIYHINRYCFIEETGYYYRYNQNSLTKSHKIIPYINALAEFKHLYNSVQKYIDKYNINNNDIIFRKKQDADRLFNTIVNIYHHKFNRKERLYHLKNDFTNDEIKVLCYFKSTVGKNILSKLVLYKHFNLIDFILNIFISLKKLVLTKLRK